MHKTSVILLLALASTHANALQPADNTRLDEVVERGVKVMPFNLDKTLHVFNKTESGGIQQVIAKDPADSEQIALIRRHLSDLAAHFAAGDFSGPKRIHGNDMPGVEELGSGYKKIRFDYRDLPNGAEIVYLSQKPALIAAVHRYFDAQLSDHARHAVPGGHAMHHPKNGD